MANKTTRRFSIAVILAATLPTVFVIFNVAVSFARPQAQSIVITLAGQAMIRSDLRTTAPNEIPVIQSLIKGDVAFTNFEATVAEPGETTNEGRGFLTPPET